MKKRFLNLIGLFFITSLLSAEPLRNAVCVVRANLSENTKTFLTNYRDSLSNQGFKSYAAGIDDYLKGGFGSGFIFQASNGKKYIITNRHVVESADTVTIQFEKDDGTFEDFESLKVIAIDDELDVALIEYPSSLNRAGIPAYATLLEDGDDVFTAGFPELGGNPTWQFGKGIVTNSRARIEDLVSPEISTIIQHSAQVDGGNSGGPLLVKDSNSAYGYSVSGINTWKALNRESTNFAIPMKAINQFVEDAINSRNANATIEGKLEKFNASIANKEETFGRMSSYISNDMISSLSSETFLRIVDSASKDARDLIIDYFLYNPLEGIRYSLAAYIWNCFRKKDALLPYTTSAPESEGDTYNVTFVINEKTMYNSKWIKSQGTWKLVDFNGIASGELVGVENKGLSFHNPFSMSLYGGVCLDIPSSEKPGFNLGFAIKSNDYFSMGFAFNHDTLKNNEYNIINADVRLTVPFNLGKVILIPYGTLGLGVFFATGNSSIHDSFNFGFLYGLGLEVVYDTGKIGPFIGVQYGGKKVLGLLSDSPKDISNTSININIGIKLSRQNSFKLW